MLDKLIQQGKTYNFINNSETDTNGTFGKPTSELLGWIATVDNFIREYYGEKSGPYKMYLKFDQSKLTGYYESDFNSQIEILMGALTACRQLEPIKKETLKDDHPLITLIKNIYFRTAIVPIISGAFMLGIYIGALKFGKEKIEYYELTKQQAKELNEIKKISIAKDSTINILKNRITYIQKNLIKHK
ncbi:MAG: hypothetical protein HGB06_04450 [Chlorobaculum sp.]|jgi:hypothetical protein|nr:hypothetical protein [Chlorobaculum sp.]